MKNNTHEVAYDPLQTAIVITNDGVAQKKIDPYELRLKCKCAGCIDEVDGR